MDTILNQALSTALVSDICTKASHYARLYLVLPSVITIIR